MGYTFLFGLLWGVGGLTYGLGVRFNSSDLERLAPLGTRCPDHFLRTKIQPLILNLGFGKLKFRVATV